jgi:N-acetylneuraminic acid mutarotase
MLKLFPGYLLWLGLACLASLAPVQAAPPFVNYAGQVSSGGQPFNGTGQFKFAFVNADANVTYWSQDGTSSGGSQPAGQVTAPVNGGYYAILLGNTAISGMAALDPTIFKTHSDVHLRVWFSDGVAPFQELAPHRPFASVPYALNAGVADGSITKSMLGADVLTDLNASAGGAVPGGIIAVPYGQSPPAGYAPHKLGLPANLSWQEKATISTARNALDGVEALDGKIYFAGTEDKLEHYDPANNQWTVLNSMSTSRTGMAVSVLNGKIYAIGGNGLSSVEVFDPQTGQWSAGPALPTDVFWGKAITVNGKIYLIGGKTGGSGGQVQSTVYAFDPAQNTWTSKANLPTARDGMSLAYYRNRIWAMGGWNGSIELLRVDSYDPVADQWREEISMTKRRNGVCSWVFNGRLFVGGGLSGGNHFKAIECYDQHTRSWTVVDFLPIQLYCSGTAILGDQLYLVGGRTSKSPNVYTDKLWVADLSAAMNGVSNLYVREGNASAGPSSGAQIVGASLANPYGIKGTPITGRNYTVPAGKVLVMTSSGHGVHVTGGGGEFRSHTSPPSILPAGSQVSTSSSSYSWSGLLFEPKDGITPVVARNYTVPVGKILVMTSSGHGVHVTGGGGEFRSHTSPPSILPAGSQVSTPSSSYSWSGYLMDE